MKIYDGCKNGNGTKTGKPQSVGGYEKETFIVRNCR